MLYFSIISITKIQKKVSFEKKNKHKGFTSSFFIEANLEKSSSQNRGITPCSSPKPIILNRNDSTQIKRS